MKDSKKDSVSKKTFWNKHKKVIIISGSIFALACMGVLAFLGFKYSAFDRFLKKASLEDLQTARDKVQDEWMKHNINDEYRESLQKCREVLDNRISKLQWKGQTPTGPAFHREHGFYLPNDE